MRDPTNCCPPKICRPAIRTLRVSEPQQLTPVLVREQVSIDSQKYIGDFYESRRLCFIHSNSITCDNDDECII